MSDCECDCHMMRIGDGLPKHMPEHCQSCCEHIDFESSKTFVDKSINHEDRLIVLDLKCLDCKKTGLAVEIHYDHDRDDCWIEAEHLWEVTANG